MFTFSESSALKCVFPGQTTQIHMNTAFPTHSKYIIKNIYFDFLQKKEKNPLRQISMANLEISRHQKLVCNLVCADTLNTKINNWDTKNANIFKEIRRQKRAVKDL